MPGVARKPAQPRLDRGSTLAQQVYGGWPIAQKSLPVRDRVRSNDLLAVGTVAPADGPDGPAISFPGTTGNYLQTAASVFNPGSGDFTAALWFYLNAGGVVQSLLIPVSGTGTQASWLDLTTANLIRTSVGASVTTGTAASTLTWHFAAVTVQGTTVTLYLDKAQVAQSTRTVASYSGAKLRVGAGSTGTNALNGLVDRLMLWQRALTAAEVARTFAAPDRMWTPPESTWAAFNYVAPVGGGGGLILPRGFDGGYAG